MDRQDRGSSLSTSLLATGLVAGAVLGTTIYLNRKRIGKVLKKKPRRNRAISVDCLGYDEIGSHFIREELSELDSQIWADETDSVIGGESLFATDDDEIARGYEIKRSKWHLVNKIIISEISLASLREDNIWTVNTAKHFVNKVWEAEESMIRKRVRDFVEYQPTKEEIKEELSDVCSEGPHYQSLMDKFEADNRIREKEGMGVRLPLSNVSDNTESQVLKKKVHKLTPKKQPSVDKVTACSEHDRKIKREGVVSYPTVGELEDKNNYMFYQVFSALTDGYVNEEMEGDRPLNN